MVILLHLFYICQNSGSAFLPHFFSLGVTLLRLHLTIRQSSQAAPMGHQCLHCDLSCKQCSGIQEMSAFEIHLDAQITTHENALFFLYSVLMHHSRV